MTTASGESSKLHTANWCSSGPEQTVYTEICFPLPAQSSKTVHTEDIKTHGRVGAEVQPTGLVGCSSGSSPG